MAWCYLPQSGPLIQGNIALADDLFRQPFIQSRRAESPQLTYLNRRNLSIACHALQRLGMNPQHLCRFPAIEEWFKFLFARHRVLQNGIAQMRISLGCLTGSLCTMRNSVGPVVTDETHLD